MDALILIVHGSRDPKWREPFEVFTQQLKNQFGQDTIHLCYMEIAKPKLIDVVKKIVPLGVTYITVVPLFMAGGGHVDNDIPPIVQEAKGKFPDVQFKLAPPIGETAEVISAMTTVIWKLLDRHKQGGPIP